MDADGISMPSAAGEAPTARWQHWMTFDKPVRDTAYKEIRACSQQSQNREYQYDRRSMRREFSVGRYCGFHDLHDYSIFGFIQPGCVILFQQEIEHDLPVLKLMLGTKIIRSSTRNIL
jgi:hypothetical protein